VVKAVFFDAVGTLIQLQGTVGEHYARVGREVGLKLDPQLLDQAFRAGWKLMPPRPAIEGPRDDDDKGWWRALVEIVLADAAPSLHELDRDNFFEVAYEHFAEAGVWQLYADVFEVIGELSGRARLAVVSNFDGRLRMILEQLGISKFFAHVFVSSEIGADKPDPEIFRRALRFMDLRPEEVLHVGDDPERDWQAAEAAGMGVFRLQRPNNTLRDLLTIL
jgi:putative hydrolase of the HAD superfamily